MILSNKQKLEVEEIIKLCSDKNDYTEQLNKLSFPQKIYLFRKFSNDSMLFDNEIILLSRLFKPNEALFLYKNVSTIEEKKLLYYSFSNANKIKYANEVLLGFHSYIDALKTIDNEDTRFNIILNAIKNNVIDDYNVAMFLDYVHDDNQLKLLISFFNNTYKNGKKIGMYTLESILEKIDKKYRLQVIKEYEKYYEFKNIYLCDMSSMLMQDDIVPFFIERINKNDFTNCYGLNIVFNKLNLHNKKLLLQELISADVLNSTYIGYMLKDCDIDEIGNIIDFVENLNVSKSKEIVTDSLLATIISNRSYEEGKIIYKRYTIDNNLFDKFKLFKFINGIEKQLYYLDYVTSLISKEELNNNFISINDYMNNRYDYYDGPNIYKNLINAYSDYYGLNYNNAILFIKSFGYRTLTFFSQDNIKNIINLPQEQFNNLINLFNSDNNKLDNNTLNNICNSLLQRKYRIENKEDYNIFSNIENIINSHDEDAYYKLEKILVKINVLVDVSEYLAKDNINTSQFINMLLKGDKNALDTLHDITQNYIMKSREEYVNSNLTDFIERLNIKIKIDRSSFKKEIFKTCSEKDIFYTLDRIKEKFTEEENNLFNNRKVLSDIYNFKKNPKEFDEKIKPYLKTYESLLNKLYEYCYSYFMPDIDESKFSHTYFTQGKNNEFLLNILSNINVNQFKDKVLSDENTFKSLVDFINKYKILGWNNTFYPVEEETDIICNEATIASLISNYYVINKHVKDDNGLLTKYIDYANCYDDASNRIVKLLGKDNYRLVSSNVGKNKSNTTRKDRLDKIPELVKMMYSKNKITVPPINKNYSINDKSVKVVIGNTTNMINLSYGERTGACLRVGGAFNDLFEFCLGDKNGFHIRFVDPDTNKFITRVSGIRNGNTIFLNELRNSVNDKYLDDEIVLVLKEVCNDLIEISKNEENPIENIVISSDYAMNKYDRESVNTGLTDEDNPFYGLSFNIITDSKFIVLKTKNEDNKLVPYNLGKDKSKLYDSLRDEVIYLDNKEDIIDNYSKIIIIDGIMKNIPIEEIDIKVPDNLVYAIAGEDWIIGVDNNYNIYNFIVENSKNKTRQTEEMNNGLEYINEFINTKGGYVK